MKTCALILVLVSAHCIAETEVLGGTWRELLDRADSLIAAGDTISARALLEEVHTEAHSLYGRPDTTVRTEFDRDTGQGHRVFRDYAQAESLYSQVLEITRRISGESSLEAASIEMDLGKAYSGQGKYERARASYAHALATREALLEPPDPDIAATVEALALLYSDLGRYEDAEPLLMRELSITESLRGPEHPDVARSLDNLASVYTHQGRYEEAEPLRERALVIREKSLGHDHLDVGLSLNNLGTLYHNMGRWEEADSLYRRALSIYEKTLGTDHPDVATCLNNLGCLYHRPGEYEMAEGFHRRALEIWEKTLGPDHPDVALALKNLAYCYRMRTAYLKAEPLLLRVIEIREKAFGPDHPDLVSALDDLANLYSMQGRYDEAEPLHRRALAIAEKAHGSEHPTVAACLNNLANLYYYLGKYPEAERLHRRALNIRQKTTAPEDPRVAVGLQNLAILASIQGRGSEAEVLYRRAIEIWEKSVGPEHPGVASALSGLAFFYIDHKKYDQAESLLRRALEINEKAWGEENADVAASLNDLAILYSEQGKCEEAEQLYLQALNVRKRLLGPEHPDVASTLKDLAILYSGEGRFEEAEPLYLRALEITEKAVGPKHPDLASIVGWLSLHHRLRGNTGAALEAGRRAFEIRKDNFRDASTLMSEKNAFEYSKVFHKSAYRFLSAFFDSRSHTDSALVWASDVVLSTKGQASEAALVRAGEMNMLNELGSIGDSLRLARTLLSRLHVSGPGDGDQEAYRRALEQASRAKDRFDAEIASTNASYRNLQEVLRVDTRSIIAALNVIPRSITLVEYMRYDYEVADTRAAIPHYLVLVLDRTGPISVIDLGETAEIDDLISTYRQHMLGVASGGKRPDGRSLWEYRSLAESLYSMIWKPVENTVSGAGLVIVAPDGGLSLISFAGLPDSNGRYLVEKLRTHYLSAGRDLVRLKEQGTTGSGLFAIGDPDYDAPPALRALPAEVQHPTSEPWAPEPSPTRSARADLSDFRATPLPGTRAEVEQVARSWQNMTSEPLAVYLGAEASEERLKAEASGKRVLHLATHGFFAGSTEKYGGPETEGADAGVAYLTHNPLLSSGLMLAGANLHGESAVGSGAEDGILTAEEVTTMNLLGTQLVVLSACETGLGEVREGEDVYGLRRAFQMAGARTVVSALWPVSDTATAEMMGGLCVRRSESLADAMHRVQMEHLTDLREAGQADHPFTWAAFIAVGDWR